MGQTSHKRIAKNTVYLYGRMIVTMLLGLYISKVVLNALGVTDYGVYSVVGGVVSMLGFFSASVGNSTQRFLNVSMVNEDTTHLRNIFSTSINAHIIIGLVTVILLEIIGIWFIKTKLVIPDDSIDDAMWVFQCSVITFFISIVSTPYTSVLIANEKMSVFAWFSIIEVTLRLGAALLIAHLPAGRLKLYALLLMGVSIIMRIIYNIYCLHHFSEAKYKWIWNTKLLKEMFSYSGWMIFGSSADMLSGQGVNMLINIFFGPVYNASRAIAMQVQSAVGQFSSNFIVSVNPQIVKSYAAKDYSACYKLVYLSSKMSFFLMLIIITPLVIHIDKILMLWLDIVPPDTSVFVTLILFEFLIRASYTPIAKVNEAHGKIKSYQMSISTLFLLVFVGSWILFECGFPVYTTFILSLCIAILGLFVRLFVMYRQFGFPMSTYLQKVTFRLCGVFITTFGLTYLISSFYGDSIISIIGTVFSSLFLSSISLFSIGLDVSERRQIVNLLVEKVPQVSKFIRR